MVKFAPKFHVAVVLLGVLGCDPKHEGVLRVRSSLAPLRLATPEVANSGRYIVRLTEGAALEPVMALVPTGEVRPLAQLGAFAATLDQSALAAIRSDPQVEDVEEDQVAFPTALQQDAWWGLDRIDHAYPVQSDSKYAYTYAGYGVNVYVFDTGIDPTHPDFNGRVKNVFAISDLGRLDEDLNGHGTAVAGVIGSRKYGVAKGANLIGIRVFNSALGSGVEAILGGINWLLGNVRRPAVANLSLTVGPSDSLNAAVEQLVDAGVFVVVAAGNVYVKNNVTVADACTGSPASAPSAMTVASSDQADNAYSLSMGGPCVDIYAPGDVVTTTENKGTYVKERGTSFAAPMVAGVAALLEDAYGDLSPQEITQWLKSNATTGLLTAVPEGGPNLLLNKVDL